MTLGAGNDRIDLYFFGPAHTNGDAFVVFPAARAMHTGDAFGRKATPFIDFSNGGSGISYPDTLAKAVATIKGVDVLVTGHSMTTLKWSDLADFEQFNRAFREFVVAAHKAGKSSEQAFAELKLPAKFKEYDLGGAQQNIATIYRELQN